MISNLDMSIIYPVLTCSTKKKLIDTKVLKATTIKDLVQTIC